MQKLNKAGLFKKGSPYFGWLAAIGAIVSKFAMRFGISLIFYSDEDKTEYGGTTQLQDTTFYSTSYQKKKSI